MDALTLFLLLSFVFWAGWLGHWIASKKQRSQLKRYKALMAELGAVIPARMRQPERKRKNGR